MRVARHSTRHFRLPLARPLATAHGSIAVREGVIVRLVDAEGRVGVGEAAPLPGFELETLPEAEAAIDRTARTLGDITDGASIDTLLDRVDAENEKTPCARAALDTALHDLAARGEDLPLATWLARAEGREPRARVAIAALLRAHAPGEVAREARGAVEAGFRALKLKVAASDDDLARVAALRAVCPDDVELRLDANAGWSEDEAKTWLHALAPFRPAWVEQPVASADALARLRRTCRVPLGVDEGLASAHAAQALADSGAADLWVVKPAVVGGLRAARRLAARARVAGSEAVISGFLDTAIGSAAALALAAAIADARPAGLDPVLAQDLAELPALVRGERELPAGPGLGVTA